MLQGVSCAVLLMVHYRVYKTVSFNIVTSEDQSFEMYE